MKTVLSCLASTLLVGLTWAEKGTGHEERIDMPFKPQPITLTTPPMNFAARGGVSIVQVNVDGAGQNILNDAANEPSITMDPTNPNRIAVGWRQFANIASNFRQAGYGYSSDGGQTWTANTYDPTVFRSDPVLETTASGTFHYNSLQQTFYSDEMISTNYGMTWGPPNFATGGDKQWIAIDKTPTSPGFGFIHQWWSTAGNNYSGRQYSRSTNGGLTWSDPVNITNRPIWGTIAIDAAGRIYLGGTASGSPGLRVARSLNASNSAATPTFTSVTPNLLGDISNGLAINPGGLSGQVSCVADTGNSPYAGTVYLLSSIVRTDNNNLDVIFAKSTNQGQSFSTALKVNDDAVGQGHFHWFGVMNVAKNGRLDAVWLDTRNDPNKSRSQLFYSYSLNGGTSWSANEALTPSFDPLIGWPQQNKIGDYMGMVSTNDHANVIFPATFTGGQDVYFARIPAPETYLTGTASLSSYVGSPVGQSTTYEVLNSGGSVVQSGTVSLNASGGYAIAINPNLLHTALTVKVKVSHWLRKVVYSGTVGLTGASAGTDTMTNGDCSLTDNIVDIGDYTLLSAAFSATPTDANWNPNADLNGDSIVDIADYTILSAAFSSVGE